MPSEFIESSLPVDKYYVSVKIAELLRFTHDGTRLLNDENEHQVIFNIVRYPF